MRRRARERPGSGEVDAGPSVEVDLLAVDSDEGAAGRSEVPVGPASELSVTEERRAEVLTASPPQGGYGDHHSHGRRPPSHNSRLTRTGPSGEFRAETSPSIYSMQISRPSSRRVSRAAP